MGNHLSKKPKYTDWDIDRLSYMTGLSPIQIHQLFQRFDRKAGHDGELDRHEFIRLMTELGYDTHSSLQNERSFRAFDKDHSGKLSFEEFIMALTLSNNKVHPRERFQYFINTYNPYGPQGYVTPDYARSVISSMNHFWGVELDANQVWTALDTGSGQVPQTAFIEYLYQTPAYMQYFA